MFMPDLNVISLSRLGERRSWVLTSKVTRPQPARQSMRRGLKVPVVSKSPEEAAAHFGSLAMFVGHDLSASSVQPSNG
jgi:hypothetical protein